MKDKNGVEDEYPHWRTALFGNHNAVANLRCAAHYVLWHGTYGLLGVIGLTFATLIKGAQFGATYLGPIGRPIGKPLNKAARLVKRAVNHSYVETVAWWGFVIALVVCVIGIAVTLVMIILQDLIQFLIGLGAVIAGTIVVFAVLVAIEYLKESAHSTANMLAGQLRKGGEKAVQTPGVRRVYGECPVSMDQAPKWFDNLFPEDEL